MAYDRREVLDRTDLAALADEVLGPHKGRGTSSAWPCPHPDHGPQTGRTPPLGVFVSHAGEQRWRCHGCGAAGTAADLVMVTQRVGFREAIEALARRAGVAEQTDAEPFGRVPRPAVSRPAPTRPGVVSPEVERHVAACEAWLWSPAGAPMRRWLGRRGLGEGVLRANRVGADPGPQSLRRARGLPRGGPAVVLPVLDPDGRAVYLQARYLRPPGGRKYDNPAAALAGPSPRLAEVRLPAPPADASTVLVCEGLPDALTAAQAGHRAAAVLGAGLPDDRLAAALARRYPTEALVVAFDADDRGRAGAQRLEEGLAQAGAGHRVGTLEVPGAWGDLNGWALAAAERFAAELGRAVEAAAAPVPVIEPPPREPSPRLAEALETIHYEHVLVDSPALAARNLARVREAVEQWGRPGSALVSANHGATALDQRLEALTYEHLLVDDPAHAARNLGEARAAVAGWAEEIGADLGRSRWLVLADPSRMTPRGVVEKRSPATRS